MKKIYLSLWAVLIMSPHTPLFAQDLLDSQLTFASQLETEGRRLQKIQDTLGIEAAHTDISKNYQEIASQIRTSFFQKMEFLSEEEITELLNHVNIKNELDYLILSDRSLSSSRKLFAFSIGRFLDASQKRLESLKQNAKVLGYEKVFNDMALIFRSRESDTLYQSGSRGWMNSRMLITYFLIFSRAQNDCCDTSTIHYDSENSSSEYAVNFKLYGIGLGFMTGPIDIRYWGNGPIEGVYRGFQLSLGAMASGTLGFLFNENGMIVLYNLFLGFGVGVGYTEVTISTHHKYIYDGPDLDDPKYKITPVPLPR